MTRLRPITLVVACAALVWLLAACRGNDEPVPFAVDEQAKVACTETCALNGQPLIGVATEAVAGGAGDTIGRVRLNGAF